MALLSALIGGGATIASSLIGGFMGGDGGDAADWARISKKYGRLGLNRAAAALEAGPGDFIPEEQPGYKYGYQEFVEKPINRLASARGRYFSPATVNALSRGAQDYASTQYDAFINRWLQTKVNPNLAMAGMGQSALGYTDMSGTNRANALMAGIGGLSNIAMKYLDRPQAPQTTVPSPYATANQLRLSTQYR